MPSWPSRCSAGAAHAQVDRATITGTVSDESGGALTTATVTVTNTETKIVNRVKTNDDGGYLVVNLIPGQYVVEAEAAGFQNRADAVILEIGQRARLDITLGVGTLSEAVTVEAQRRLLNTEQAAVGHRARPERDRQAAAGHPQLGRPAGAWSPACRATATARRAARPRSAAPAA